MIRNNLFHFVLMRVNELNIIRKKFQQALPHRCRPQFSKSFIASFDYFFLHFNYRDSSLETPRAAVANRIMRLPIERRKVTKANCVPEADILLLHEVQLVSKFHKFQISSSYCTRTQVAISGYQGNRKKIQVELHVLKNCNIKYEALRAQSTAVIYAPPES